MFTSVIEVKKLCEQLNTTITNALVANHFKCKSLVLKELYMLSYDTALKTTAEKS